MNTDPATYKVVALVTVGVLTGVVILIFATYIIFGVLSTTSESEGLLTQDTTASIVLDTAGSNDPNWRQSVVAFESEPNTELFEASAPEVFVQPTVVEEVNKRTSYESFTAPVFVPPDLPVTPSPQPTILDLTKLETSSFSDCGTLDVPGSSFGRLLFAGTADQEPVVICIGKAIGDDCEAYRAEILSDGAFSAFVYVTERNDGLCSVGLSTNGNLGQFCSIESVMDATNVEDKTEAEWQGVFAADPGGTTASLVTENSSLLSGGSVSGTDCVDYSL